MFVFGIDSYNFIVKESLSSDLDIKYEYSISFIIILFLPSFIFFKYIFFIKLI